MVGQSKVSAFAGRPERSNRLVPDISNSPLLTRTPLRVGVPDQRALDTSGGCSAIIGPSPDGSAMPSSSHVWRPSRTCWATA